MNKKIEYVKCHNCGSSTKKRDSVLTKCAYCQAIWDNNANTQNAAMAAMFNILEKRLLNALIEYPPTGAEDE